jgi:hypothetical protein
MGCSGSKVKKSARKKEVAFADNTVDNGRHPKAPRNPLEEEFEQAVAENTKRITTIYDKTDVYVHNRAGCFKTDEIIRTQEPYITSYTESSSENKYPDIGSRYEYGYGEPITKVTSSRFILPMPNGARKNINVTTNVSVSKRPSLGRDHLYNLSVSGPEKEHTKISSDIRLDDSKPVQEKMSVNSLATVPTSSTTTEHNNNNNNKASILKNSISQKIIREVDENEVEATTTSDDTSKTVKKVEIKEEKEEDNTKETEEDNKKETEEDNKKEEVNKQTSSQNDEHVETKSEDKKPEETETETETEKTTDDSKTDENDNKDKTNNKDDE